MRKKADLPTKICPVCQRPFCWRKNGKKLGMKSAIALNDAVQADQKEKR